MLKENTQSLIIDRRRQRNVTGLNTDLAQMKPYRQAPMSKEATHAHQLCYVN